MKYDEVKTKKQNYLVFFRNSYSIGIFLSQVPSFSYLPFSMLSISWANLTFPVSSQTFHRLMELRILLSALTLSFNSLTQAGECPSRAGEKAGGKFKDILHNYRSFLFR